MCYRIVFWYGLLWPQSKMASLPSRYFGVFQASVEFDFPQGCRWNRSHRLRTESIHAIGHHFMQSIVIGVDMIQ